MSINAIQQSYNVPQTAPAAKNPTGGDSMPETANNHDTAEQVHLSTRGKSLSELPPLLLPTRENVQKLSVALSAELQNMFSQAGINPDPAVEFAVDPYSGKVSVKSDRPDAQQIAELLRQNPEIEMQIHNVAALSSHVVAMGPAMEADRAYRAAQSQAEIDKVIAKYAAVYSGQTKVTNFSVLFNGTDVQINADGADWMSTKAAPNIA